MPDEYATVPCTSCGRPVLWTLTQAGRRLAVDPDPHPEGNTAVYRDAIGTLKSRGLSKERPTPDHLEWQARPHFATCPNRPPARPRGRGRAPQGGRPYWQQGRPR